MSRSDRFDRGDFGARYARPEVAARGTTVQPASWPIARGQIHRVGQSVLTDRNGQGRPHKGIDLFASAGTPVLAAQGGRVLRVVDGRSGTSISQRRAGLFVDVLGLDTLVYRYLHLGDAHVQSGQTVRRGALLGAVAAAHTSGLADSPHLHFEVRLGDVDHSRKDYGTSIDPLRLLPPLQV